jgi:REP element-mobilizing transposase RayT
VFLKHRVFGIMPKRIFRAGEYYHLYNRGNKREPIFFEWENYRFFLTRLRRYFTSSSADIVAYCLMPNHYHLLVHLHQDDIGKAMHPLGMGYAKAINKRYERAGHLFQGQFQAKHVETTAQLLYLSCYIHLNPVRAKLVNHSEEWIYSSYPDYIGVRRGTLPNPQVVLEHFESPQHYQQFVEKYQDKDREQIASLLFD